MLDLFFKVNAVDTNSFIVPFLERASLPLFVFMLDHA